jgi:16S rRNA (cytosine1402-N4)-methyltransferase
VTVHVPILLRPIVDSLIEPFKGLPQGSLPHACVDCTLGGGGHTSALLEAFRSDPKLAHHKVISVDQDSEAIARAQERFRQEIDSGRLILIHSRFSEIEEELKQIGVPVLGLMADLGFSSDQLEDEDRGISFKGDGPLDMRLDPTRGVSAYQFLQKVTQGELEKILMELGEERFSRKVAAAIIQARRDRQLPDTTRGLADLVTRAVPPPARHGRIHAATRTFQALRIHVNEELKELDQLLGHVILSIKARGRVAIISFHSLEDRRVKLAFKGELFEPLTKKPVEADEEELRLNPRSRSAKLRIAERVQS